MQLNPDESGQIVYQKINPDELKQDVRKIIDPIIEELEALDQPLNFEEFFDAMERLLDTLNPQEKNIILAPKKRWTQELKDMVKPSHQPQINKSFRSVQRAESAKPIFLRTTEKRQAIDQRLQKQRVERAQNELQSCSFKPKINNYKVLMPDSSSYYFSEDFTLLDSPES